MTTYIRAYMRASTSEQDASRAKADLEHFTKERGHRIAACYIENESGAALRRPELFRLLGDCHPGDVMLVEQVDRLSRLNADDWKRLRSEIAARKVRVVSLDLPTSWPLLTTTPAGKGGDVDGEDEFTARMYDAINSMMLDVLAAVARKDYSDRRRRQAQGIEAAKARGAYRGRPENVDRNKAIVGMLRAGQSWSAIVKATGCSRSTLSRLSKRVRDHVAAVGEGE